MTDNTLIFLIPAMRHIADYVKNIVSGIFFAVLFLRDSRLLLTLRRMFKPCRNLILSAILGLCLTAFAKNTNDSLMEQLDGVIAHREVYLAQKDSVIDVLRCRCDTAPDDRARFYALVRLYDCYSPFNTDSAYMMSLRQKEIAERIGDPMLLVHAQLNRANILTSIGMYHEALMIMDNIDRQELPQYLVPFYFHIMRTVSGSLADYAAFEPERVIYKAQTDAFRDSIISVNEPGSLIHTVAKADQLNVEGRPKEAVDLLEKYIAEHEISEHERAYCAWTLSESYGRLGDRERQKEFLIISSISDLKSSVREYVSLRQLALLLYEEGDLDRAYRFMTIAVEDATKCNARQRIVELSDSYPTINGIYVETVKHQKRTLSVAIVVIAVLAVVLVVLLLYTRKQMQRIAHARKETQDANDRLAEAAAHLSASNAELSRANNEIAEISELKEVYIGRYMDQCLAYIDKLDSYRKTLGKLLLSGKTQELADKLKSSTIIDNEFKSFYDQFDQTFLSLFPTFVEDFNSLLRPGEEIWPKKHGSLNTELRIFALIRLGISDSVSIAKFLRYSLTTIYNYRTRVRNKAKGDRNLLEEEMMGIGR